MSKKTSLKRLDNLKSNSVRANTWIQRMDEILDQERKNGLTGLHLSLNPLSSNGDIAKSFVQMENAMRDGKCIELCRHK